MRARSPQHPLSLSLFLSNFNVVHCCFCYSIRVKVLSHENFSISKIITPVRCTYVRVTLNIMRSRDREQQRTAKRTSFSSNVYRIEFNHENLLCRCTRFPFSLFIPFSFVVSIPLLSLRITISFNSNSSEANSWPEVNPSAELFSKRVDPRAHRIRHL